jgi:DNA-directed RNA polymerase specialized sigma24 family protein
LSAFAWSHREAYRRYAQARTGSQATADAALDRALEQLALAWPQALRGGSVSAHAWRIVRECVASACPPGQRRGHRTVHDVLPGAMADAVVLHYELGMPLGAAAEVMGVEPSTLAVHLLMAERVLPAGSAHLSPPRPGPR